MTTPTAEPPSDVFSAAMPKEEIGALRFLKDHPGCDGRGVVVAIFDTGVDPGALGLQTTSDGKPKILDLLDCTGSGDVDTSKVVKADEEGYITGLYGNKLKVNPDWKNPSGLWHVGAKRAFELFPGGLKKRSKQERKKRWEEKQREAVTACTAAVASHRKGDAAAGDGKEVLEELELRAKLLADLEDKYDDLGAMLDCVVWHDGEVSRAALDTSELYEPGSTTGALENFKPLTNYRIERQYGVFSSQDSCNFALNIYDEGNVLSIVVDAGAHGTHVAGITAAHHPDHPELNGIAPGAQIISCKIGDSRLGSMETGVGLTRALIAVLDHKVDLINMSYGESTATPNAGRFITLANEVVHKHNVIFVSSAGNAGPALSTVGAPGGTSSSIISIGAYVSPGLAAAGHSVREALDKGQQYTWSSRGPTLDGHIGVTLSAPGGAIAPVPQWTQEGRQLMNGTSMASPNACGGIALVLSAAKAKGWKATPIRVRRALENTCLPLGGDAPDAVLTYGRGLLQVDKAVEYFEKATALDERDEVLYEVRVRRSNSSATGRGIYLREPFDSHRAVTCMVEVRPTVHEVAASTSTEDPEKGLPDRQAILDAEAVRIRLAIEDKLHLQSTQPWVTTPSALLLPSGGRTFEIKVDAGSLPEGLHFAELCAFDSSAPWRGPLFRVPVTVVRPMQVDTHSSPLSGTLSTSSGASKDSSSFTASFGWLDFTPGLEVRRFVAVPEGATWAELRITTGDNEQPRVMMVRASQLLPHTRFSDTEARATLSLAANAEERLSFATVAGATVEVTLAQFWSSLGPGRLRAEVVFHGLEARREVFLDGSRHNTKLHVRAPFRSEKFAPAAKLSTVRIPLRPTEAVLAPLPGARDVLPNGRTIHTLTLTYKLTVAEAGKHTVTLPLLNRYVYDGELEGQMTFLTDTNKRLIKVSDIYPEDVQLGKGEYIIRAQLRHDDTGLLEKLRGLAAVVERKLGDSVTVPIYGSQVASLKAVNETFKEQTLHKGQRAALFLGPVPEDKLPKDASPGRILVGTLALAKKENGKGEAPGKVSLSYSVPPKKENGAGKDGADKNGKGEDKEILKTPEERLKEAVRDAQVSFLKQMKRDTPEEDAAYMKFDTDLLKEHPKHLPLLSARLASIKSVSPELHPKKFEEVVAAADEVIAAIDTTALAKHLARKTPEEGPGAAAKKKEAEEQKTALLDALEKKANALLELQPTAPEKTTSAAGPEEQASASEVPADSFEAAILELQTWADTTEETYALLHAKRLARKGRFAGALKALEKSASPEDKPPAKEVLLYREELFQKLGWQHWALQEESRIKECFPSAYALF
ncbi:g9538 [Coccomyxa elongata]